MTARNTTWLRPPARGKLAQACRSVLATHEGEEVHLGRRGLSPPGRPLGLDPRAHRGEHPALDRLTIFLALPERVADGAQPGLLLIAPEDISEADLPRRDLHRRARDRRLADV